MPLNILGLGISDYYNTDLEKKSQIIPWVKYPQLEGLKGQIEDILPNWGLPVVILLIKHLKII